AGPVGAVGVSSGVGMCAPAARERSSWRAASQSWPCQAETLDRTVAVAATETRAADQDATAAETDPSTPINPNHPVATTNPATLTRTDTANRANIWRCMNTSAALPSSESSLPLWRSARVARWEINRTTRMVKTTSAAAATSGAVHHVSTVTATSSEEIPTAD